MPAKTSYYDRYGLPSLDQVRPQRASITRDDLLESLRCRLERPLSFEGRDCSQLILDQARGKYDSEYKIKRELPTNVVARTNDFMARVEELAARFNGERGVFSAADVLITKRTRREHLAQVKHLQGEIKAEMSKAEAQGNADKPEYFRLKRFDHKLQEERLALEYYERGWYDTLRPRLDSGEPLPERKDEIDENIKKRLDLQFQKRLRELIATTKAQQAALTKKQQAAQKAREFVTRAQEQIQQLKKASEQTHGKELVMLKTSENVDKLKTTSPSRLTNTDVSALSADVVAYKADLESQIKSLSEQMHQLMATGHSLDLEQQAVLLGISKKRRQAMKARTNLIHQINLSANRRLPLARSQS